MSGLAQLRAGDVFAGFYEIERLLKAGGMGAVYVVRHTKTGKRQALKVMRPEIVADAAMRARFEQEARVASFIDAPKHIVDVAHAGVDDATGMPFLVMELLVGKELGELVEEKGALPPAHVVEWLRQAAKALDRAHGKGVVHRDLKPENLFLVERDDEPPIVKILDFGIAKIVQGASQQSATNAGGTPLYMAPEQTSKSTAIGPSTDVWALGLIAYALLVGAPYWQAEDLNQLYREILIDPLEAPSIRAARRGVTLPPEFDTWMLTCLSRDPAGRFQRAGAAIDALATALGASPRTSAPTPIVAPVAASIEMTVLMTGAAPVPIGASTTTGAASVGSTQGPSPTARWLFPVIGAALLVGGVGVYFAARTDAKPPLATLPSDHDEPPSKSTTTSAAPTKPSAGPVATKTWQEDVDALNPFVGGPVALQTHEVTQREYDHYLAASDFPPSARPLASSTAPVDSPVSWVTYEQATAYCRAIGARLPTSDEWTAALPSKAWPSSFAGIAIGKAEGAEPVEWTAAVSDVTPAGIHDLAGNVQEWTSTERDGMIVVRGASVQMDATEARTAIAEGFTKFTATAAGANAKKEAIAGAMVGFRCAR